MDENYMADNAEETVEENTEVIGDSAAEMPGFDDNVTDIFRLCCFRFS